MRYKNLLETDSAGFFEKACQLLADHKIPYETLYEYRLVNEQNYDLAGGGGGALIRVSEDSYDRAHELLSKAGFRTYVGSKRDQFFFVETLDNLLSNVPFIRNHPTPYKLLLLLCGIGTIVLFSVLKIHYDDWQNTAIVDRNLIVKSITYKGEHRPPNTTQLFEMKGLPMREAIEFRSGRPEPQAILPGFNTPMVVGAWYFSAEGDQLILSNVQDFSELYNGTYEIERDFWKKEIIMRSETTEIVLFLN